MVAKTSVAAQRQALEVLSRSQAAPHRQVTRVRALLMAADGVANARIAATVGVSVVTVRAWGDRFTQEGLAKLGQVRAGRGPKSSTSAKKVEAIVSATLTTTPGATRWSCRSMTAAFGVSASTVQRIWLDLDLKPHRVDTFRVSNDRCSRRS